MLWWKKSNCLPFLWTGYIFEYNEWIKKEISDDIIGLNEKCKSCINNPELKYQCQNCNDGYYLSDKNKTICERCNKEGCLKCYNLDTKIYCSKCEEGYELINNECVEEKCEIGDNEKCASCKRENGKRKECETCNQGYYLNENSNMRKCTKYFFKNCINYSNEADICIECMINFDAIKIKKDKLKNVYVLLNNC